MEIPPYLFLTILLAMAVLFAVVPLVIARFWALAFLRRRQGLEKTNTYECGIEATGAARIQFNSQYYHYGILFLIFDVEAVFLLPFAVVFLDLPVGAVVAMLIFVLLLLEGLLWAWMKGILVWK